MLMAEVRDAEGTPNEEEVWYEEIAASADDKHIYEALASERVQPNMFNHWAMHACAYSIGGHIHDTTKCPYDHNDDSEDD